MDGGIKFSIPEIDLDIIRKAAHYCQPVGDNYFKQAIEKCYGVKTGQVMRGRPRLIKNEEVVKI